MKIAGGRLKGRGLLEPQGGSVRPTKDIVRKAIFDSLRGWLEDRKVIDIFAGTGALGIEALSQGAAEVVFIESDRQAADTIRRNLAVLGLEQYARVTGQRAETALAALAGAGFDLALADPPYDYPEEELAGLLLKLGDTGVVAEDGLVVIEHATRSCVPDTAGWQRVRTRKYGRTSVTLLRRTTA